MKCTACSAQNIDSAKFCPECGSNLQELPKNAGADTVERLPSTAMLKKGNPFHTPGDTIDNRYQVIDEIGRGGMGVVYKVRDIKLERICILKRLIARRASDDTAFKRFKREATTIAKLNHRNIVIVYDVGTDERGTYIVMEYIDGKHLEKYVREKGALTGETAFRLIRQLLDAVSYAHKIGVIHRDLKPANILLTQDCTPKIVDFGIAKEYGTEPITVTEEAAGTPIWTAKEQWKNFGRVDHRTDIFSLGLICYYILTGKEPQPLRLDLLPEGVRDIIAKATEENLVDRFFSVDEMLSAFGTKIRKEEAGSEVFVKRAETSGATGEQCPSCGNKNAADARYCEACGVGLFEKCPKCENEMRTGRPFCPKCGLNVQKLNQVKELISRAKQAEHDGNLAEAMKFARDALAVEPSSRDAKEIADKCTTRLKEIGSARNELAAQMKAENYEDAEALCKRILYIDSSDSAAQDVLSKIPSLIRQRDTARLVSEARDAIAGHDYQRALEVVMRGLKIDPDYAPLQEILKVSSEQMEKLRKVIEFAHDALSRGDFDEAGKLAQEAAQISPESAEIKKLQKNINSKRSIFDLNSENAKRFFAAKEFSQAIKAAQTALQIRPDDEELGRIYHESTNYLEVIKENLDAARDNMLKYDYDKALKTIEAVLAIAPGLEGAKKLKKEAEAKAKNLESHVQKGKESASKKKWAVASYHFNEALKLKPNSEQILQDVTYTKKQYTRRLLVDSLLAIGSILALDITALTSAALTALHYVATGASIFFLYVIASSLWNSSRFNKGKELLLAGKYRRGIRELKRCGGAFFFGIPREAIREEVGRLLEKSRDMSETKPEDAVMIALTAITISSDDEAANKTLETVQQKLFEHEGAKTLGFRRERAMGSLTVISGVPRGKDILTLTGHTQSVRAVAITPDGKLIISASDDSTLKVWDAVDGKKLRTLLGHSQSVTAIACTPDGKLAISGGADKTLKIWSLSEWKETGSLYGHTGNVNAVAIAKDGRFAVSASDDKTLKIWDLATAKEIRTLSGHAAKVCTAAITADGKLAISGSADKTVRIWEVETGNEVMSLVGHSGRVNSIVVCPDGKTFVSASDDKTLKFWDIMTGRELQTVQTGHSDWVLAVDISSGGRYLVTGSYDKTMRIWEFSSMRELRTLSGHMFSILALAIHPDGGRVVSGSADNYLRVWDISSRTEVRTQSGQVYGAMSVAATADEKIIFFGDADGTVKVWDTVGGKELFSLAAHSGAVNAVAISPDGKHAASGGADRNVRVWDAAGWKPIRTLAGHTAAVETIWICSPEVSDGGVIIVSRSSAEVILWNASTGEVVATFRR